MAHSASSRSGPSPRVRGKHAYIWLKEIDIGSIPARAGETPCHPVRPWRREVHPRACGGNGMMHPAVCRAVGPSPRVRGKLLNGQLASVNQRSIPARAGETTTAARGQSVPQVHPPACGGNKAWVPSWSAVTGPSPRVRGKPQYGMHPSLSTGSIPARAGETVLFCAEVSTNRVHPRACGGNAGGPSGEAGIRGPSPRVRGKPSRVVRKRQMKRSIPARAGETSCVIAARPSSRVHPRACGGNRGGVPMSERLTGPSPRVRGKRLRGTARVGA